MQCREHSQIKSPLASVKLPRISLSFHTFKASSQNLAFKPNQALKTTFVLVLSYRNWSLMSGVPPHPAIISIWPARLLNKKYKFALLPFLKLGEVFKNTASISGYWMPADQCVDNSTYARHPNSLLLGGRGDRTQVVRTTARTLLEHSLDPSYSLHSLAQPQNIPWISKGASL